MLAKALTFHDQEGNPLHPHTPVPSVDPRDVDRAVGDVDRAVDHHIDINIEVRGSKGAALNCVYVVSV